MGSAINRHIFLRCRLRARPLRIATRRQADANFRRTPITRRFRLRQAYGEARPPAQGLSNVTNRPLSNSMTKAGLGLRNWYIPIQRRALVSLSVGANGEIILWGSFSNDHTSRHSAILLDRFVGDGNDQNTKE